MAREELRKAVDEARAWRDAVLEEACPRTGEVLYDSYEVLACRRAIEHLEKLEEELTFFRTEEE